MIRDIVSSRELAWRLFVRDVSAQYRQSIFGYLWLFIPPLVAGLPFVYLNTQGLVKIGGTPIPYAAYAIIGTTIWQVFADAVNAPLRTVTAARSVLARINLPREAILLSALAQVGLNFLVRLLLIVGAFIWFQLSIPLSAVLFPLGILALIVVGFVAGMLVTPLGLLYTDVQQILPIAITFLMLLTPVVYPVPETGLAGAVARYNPLTPLISATRDWLTLGTTTHTEYFFLVSSTAVLFSLFGWVAFRVAMPHLISRIGN